MIEQIASGLAVMALPCGQAQTIALSTSASAAAKYLAEHCPDGLGYDQISLADLIATYPDLSREDLLDGLGDLESYGLIETESYIGSADDYRMTQLGYQTLDPHIKGWNPIDDARQLAAAIVQKRDDVDCHELEAAMGWTHRRFNPALHIILGFIDSGRVSREIQPHYVTSFFSPSNAEFAQLKRFVAGE